MTTTTADRAGTGTRTQGGNREIPRDRNALEFKWIILTVFIVTYAMIPLLWILSLSFKSPATATDGKILPSDFSWENYKTIFTTNVFVRPLINSIGITVISTIIAVTLATLAAYAIARLNFPGKRLVLTAALAIAMFPPISIVGPLFNMWRGSGGYHPTPA